ncbi:Regulatory protein recX [Quillaja saponaria]|uniref:Regulatory protein RecX n=1 Tax=Quillaja saponaria TaxID=32244 RepID=A0AAD7LSR8_QUISA|nr:Regulatory protein recX [Quillaja saponaria]
MANLAGNSGFRISSQLQFRVFSIPRVARKSQIMCLKRREHSSSFPVRYIPKKSSKVEISETPLPRKSLEENKYRVKELKINVKDHGSSVQKTFAYDYKGQNQNQRPNNLVFVDEEQDCEQMGDPVDAEELNKRNVRDGCEQYQFQGERYMQDQGKLANESPVMRVVRESQITLLDSGYNNSSDPAMYICKKASKLEMSESSLPKKSLEENKYSDLLDVCASTIKIRNFGKSVQRRIYYDQKSQNQNDVSNNLFFDDGAPGCEQLGVPEETVEEFSIDQSSDCCEEDLLQAVKPMQDAEKLATGLLAKRALTVVELRKKLHLKRFSSNTVEAVINKFQNRGLINDKLYAEAFCRSRWSSSSWGPRRIKQALFNKGVSQVNAEEAVNLVFKESECGEDKELKFGLSKHSMDHLYVQASKQWLRNQNLSRERRKSRIVQWLQYRGFGWDVISYILKKLDT